MVIIIKRKGNIEIIIGDEWKEKKKKKKKEFFNKKETLNSNVFKCIFEDNWNGFERFYDFSKNVTTLYYLNKLSTLFFKETNSFKYFTDISKVL